MKKIFFVFAICSCLLFAMASCSNPSSSSDSTVYKVEFGCVSNSTYSSAMEQILLWSYVDYARIYKLRLFLYNNTISDYGFQNGITQGEIINFLRMYGFSNYEVSTTISGLETRGNDILLGRHARDSNKKVWMYVTK